MIRFSVSSRFARVSVLGSASLLLAFACSSGEGAREAEEGEEVPGDTINVGQARARLTRADSCAALLSNIQDNLIAQLEQRARELRAGNAGSGTGNGGVTPVGGGAAGVPGGVAEDDGAVAPSPQAPPPSVNPNTPRPDSEPEEAPADGDSVDGPTGGAG
ncbi:MAG: hypothetical protein ABW217_13570, partial [Polyangiaceae bacterium]